MTVKATITAALPEAKRISNFIERDFGEDGVAVSLDERSNDRWAVEAYFESGDPEDVRKTLCDRLGSDAFSAPLTVERLSETDWVALSLQGLKPVRAGRFMVHGSHDRGTITPGHVAIEIEAGQAFGTGHHGTTAGCLAALDRLVRARHYGNALDLGTGSGVLAIALAKLRVPVMAADIDPVAVRVATDNAALNGVAHHVRVHVADGLDHAALRRSAPFDLIVANILAEPLVRMAPAVARSLAPGGNLLLSGLLPSQRGRVAAAYRSQNLRLERVRLVDGWAVMTLEKPRRL